MSDIGKFSIVFYQCWSNYLSTAANCAQCQRQCRFNSCYGCIYLLVPIDAKRVMFTRIPDRWQQHVGRCAMSGGCNMVTATDLSTWVRLKGVNWKSSSDLSWTVYYRRSRFPPMHLKFSLNILLLKFLIAFVPYVAQYYRRIKMCVTPSNG